MRRKIDKLDFAAALAVFVLIYANAWVLAFIFAVGYCFVAELENELKTQKKRKEAHLSLCRILSGDLGYGK